MSTNNFRFSDSPETPESSSESSQGTAQIAWDTHEKYFGIVEATENIERERVNTVFRDILKQADAWLPSLQAVGKAAYKLQPDEVMLLESAFKEYESLYWKKPPFISLKQYSKDTYLRMELPRKRGVTMRNDSRNSLVVVAPIHDPHAVRDFMNLQETYPVQSFDHIIWNIHSYENTIADYNKRNS